MASIPQSKLDDLEASLASFQRAAKANEDRAAVAERKVKRFDDILDKIVKAATGRPLTDDLHGGYYASDSYGSVADPRMTDAERQAMEQERLRERVVSLESRLAAVVAVAQFAKGHKA